MKDEIDQYSKINYNQMQILTPWIGGKSMKLLTLPWLNLQKSTCVFVHLAVHLKDCSAHPDMWHQRNGPC